MSQAAKNVDEVLHDEIVIISERRRVQGQPNPANPHEPTSERAAGTEGLTGLALSGGGVRSAAFCLGFIQGMCSVGRMKAFDFLSTVSGGGYAGAMFSSEVAQKKGVKIDWRSEAERKQDSDFGSRLDIEPNPDGGQSERVTHLSMHGRMMSNFLRLFSRHLWGLLVNLAFAVSGIVAIAGVLAYVMRWPWDKDIMPYLRQLQFTTDLTKPFFFATIAFLIWLASHFAAYFARAFDRRVPAFTQYTYLLLLAMILLGLISVLALGDVDVTSIISSNELSANVQDRINKILNWITVGLGGVLAATLIPYLSPHRLLKSGQTDAGPVQHAIFNVAGKALLVGAPLGIFYVLVHENISGETQLRANSDQLEISHIKLPDRFIPKLEADSISDDAVERRIAIRMLAAMRDIPVKRMEQSNLEFPNKDVEKWLQLSADRKRDAEDIGILEGWVQGLASAIHVNEAFAERIEQEYELRDLRNKIVQRLNIRCLSDPELFLSLTTDLGDSQTSGTGGTNDLTDSSGNEVSSHAKDAGRDSKFLHRFGQPTVHGGKVLEFLKPDDLLAKLHLEDHQDKSQLIHAIEELQSAYQQLEKRYGAHRLPKDASEGSIRNSVPIAIVDVARERTRKRRENYLIGGPYLTALQQAAENKKDFVDQYEHTISDANDAKSKKESKAKSEEQSVDNPILSNESAVEDSVAESANSEYHVNTSDLSELNKQRDRHAQIVNQLARQVRENNWKLLHALYPSFISTQDTTYAYVVNRADQSSRLRIIGISLLIFLVVGFFVNLNTTSLHGVYRDQLAEIWLADPKMKMQDLDTCSAGGPYHLVNCTVNRMGHRSDPDAEGKSRFVISQKYCGTKKIGYRETATYQDGKTKLADAVAISGAAVTSINAPTFLHQLILFLSNFRLGQWLPNPQSYRPDFYWPSPIRSFSNLLWYPEQRSHLFVSDGGHLDNSGLGALLERRCEFMVCVDAGHDPTYKFVDLLKVVQASRSKYGIEIDIIDKDGDSQHVTKWLDPLRPNTDGISESHFIVAKVKYPEVEKPAILIFAKLTVTSDEPLELVEMARNDSHFPHDPTSNQFLTPEVFDSYLSLGRCVARELSEYIDAGKLAPFDLPLGWSQPQLAPIETQMHDSESPTHEATNPGLKKLQAKLEANAFDITGIQFATSTLSQWFQDGATQQSTDTSVPDMVFRWAKETGLDAAAEPRKQFCAELTKLAKENLDYVQLNEHFAEEIGQVLCDLGGRSKFAIRLRRSSSKQANA